MAFLDETGLAELWRLTLNGVNHHIWREQATEWTAKTISEIKPYSETKSYSSHSSGGSAISSVHDSVTTSQNTFSYGDSYDFDLAGVVYIKNPTTLTLSKNSDASVLNALKGKWVINHSEPKVLLYFPTNITFAKKYSYPYTYFYIDGASVTKYSDFYSTTTRGGYVASPNANAYSSTDGYAYLGQIGEKVRISSGSYAGTGTYGESNPSVLSFDFEPKLVVITCVSYLVSSGSAGYFPASFGIFVKGASSIAVQADGEHSSCLFSLERNVLIRRSNTGPGCQFNGSGTTYYYIAIG